MKLLPAQALRDLGVELFQTCGAPADEAVLVADHLVEASLMGIDSHGVVRYVMYVEHCLDGTIRPGAPARVVGSPGAVAVVDCGMNFGQVGAHYITDLVLDGARSGGLAFAVSRRCHHVGRLGAYPQKLAEAGTSRILRNRPNGSSLFFGLVLHGPKLVNREGLVVETHSLLGVEHGTLGGELDEDGDDGEGDRKEGEKCTGDRHVHDALHEPVPAANRGLGKIDDRHPIEIFDPGVKRSIGQVVPGDFDVERLAVCEGDELANLVVRFKWQRDVERVHRYARDDVAHVVDPAEDRDAAMARELAA